MRSSSALPRCVLSGLCAAALFMTTAAPVQAQDGTPTVQQAAGGASYVNGGVSNSEQQHMKGIASEWPLRITNALASGGDYVADAHLVVKGKDGKTVLDLDRAGPMTFVKLPAGEYRITAEHQGQSQSREVSLSGKGGHDVDFRWKGEGK